MVRVAITQDDTIERAIEDALQRIENPEELFGGKRVAVKPNDTWASRSDTSAITQPDSLRAVLRHIKYFTPSELIVTGGSGAGETDEIFRIGGLMKVIEEEGGSFFDHNRPPLKRVSLEHGPQKSVMVNPRILEYETVVVLSQLKVHETATVTLALKNIAMSYPAADYYGHPRSKEVHKHEFFGDTQSFIAGMAKRFPIHLAVTVGHPAMIGTGPIGGKLIETGLVIASTDAVAADAVGARLLGFDPQGVRHIYEASGLGVGESDFDKMEFPVLGLQEAVEIFSEKAYGMKISLEHA
ncbi:MAG TPA: DUF362 domain-containing protein [Thermodesulfobacteriota bacterium]|nr:DUF362 domain-containing protein [Thermodesulfobacteriota bacterium]